MKRFNLILAFILLVNSIIAQTPNNYQKLDSEWKFRRVGTTVWKNAKVPGTVHMDLYRNDEIPEPYYRLNEKYAQWVDKCDWEYITNFDLTESVFNSEKLMLRFKGLDTYADVFLNGEKILSADNMFRTWNVDATNKLLLEKNELRIVFYSPINRGLEELKNYGYALPSSNDQALIGGLNADERVSNYIRKAPYNFGWDWGPRFVTSGVYQDIEILAQNNTRIEDVFYRQEKVTSKKASITAVFTIDALEPGSVLLRVQDKDSGNECLKENVTLKRGRNEVEFPMVIKNPRLWWTNGLGEQELYTLVAKVEDKGKVINEVEETIGVRSLKLIETNEDGSLGACYIELNGVPVFMKGANYIPSDVFVDLMTEDVYDKVITDAVDANMNMLRVWGGGIYEQDYFYKKCDEAGILVWQDFMFACSMYPNNDAFYKSVEAEAIDNVKRLRNHPCIALWCGNNEIDTGWAMYDKNAGWGWKQQMTPTQQKEMWYAYNRIFKEILPDVVEKYDGRGYRHSSPMVSAPQKHASSKTVNDGDIHYWGVWHGKEPFENFHIVLGRFMSEYGFQSFPEMRTISQYALPKDYDIESEVMRAHQRSNIGNHTIAEYMDMYYNTPADFEDFIYLQQVLQAESIGMAIQAHRHNMPHTMGTLYWQINDCWPVASWSSTDYYRRWKALHYFVRETFKELIITAKTIDEDLQVSFVNDALKGVKDVQVVAQVMNPEGEISLEKKWTQDVKANNTTLALKTPTKEIFSDKQEFIVLKAYHKGKELARTIFYPTKIKDMNLPIVTPEFSYKYNEDNSVEITISSELLVKNIYLDFSEVEGFFSNNYFDLLPGESITVKFTPKDKTLSIEGVKVDWKSVSTLTY